MLSDNPIEKIGTVHRSIDQTTDVSPLSCRTDKDREDVGFRVGLYMRVSSISYKFIM